MAQQPVHGGCHCGNLQVEIGLTDDPGTYEPRICDCDFCRMHGASYLSDPLGYMRLSNGDGALQRYRQGAGLAEMILCPLCGVLAGAVYGDGKVLYGVVNTRILRQEFPPGTGVSPRQLAPGDKVLRWQQLWFRNVHLDARAG